MTAFRPVREMRRADNADGFQHVFRPVARIVDQVAYAAIRHAPDEGDIAKAKRLRRHWRGSKEGRI